MCKKIIMGEKVLEALEVLSGQDSPRRSFMVGTIMPQKRGMEGGKHELFNSVSNVRLKERDLPRII